MKWRGIAIDLRRSLARGLAALLLLTAVPCFAQRLALTFDDGLDPGRDPRAAAVNQQLLDALDATGVHAMLFPSLVKIGGEQGLPLVRLWAQRGHLVGNHTASHRSLSSRGVSLQDFTDDVQEADRVLAGLPTFRRMLRFPYLKEGNDASKRDGVRAWMATHGYAPASVSIDTSDWYYDQVHSQLVATGSDEQRRKLLDAYIAHLLDRAAYYDGLARAVLGRSPDHVLYRSLAWNGRPPNSLGL